MTIESVFEQAMQLTGTQRTSLVTRLLPTLPKDSASEDAAIADEWHQEIVDRLDRYDRGETTSIPEEEVYERLERRFSGG